MAVTPPPNPDAYPLTPDAPVQFGPYMGPGKGNAGPYGMGPPGFGDSNPSQQGQTSKNRCFENLEFYMPFCTAQ